MSKVTQTLSVGFYSICWISLDYTKTYNLHILFIWNHSEDNSNVNINMQMYPCGLRRMAPSIQILTLRFSPITRIRSPPHRIFEANNLLNAFTRQSVWSQSLNTVGFCSTFQCVTKTFKQTHPWFPWEFDLSLVVFFSWVHQMRE